MRKPAIGTIMIRTANWSQVGLRTAEVNGIMPMKTASLSKVGTMTVEMMGVILIMTANCIQIGSKWMTIGTILTETAQ